MPQSKLELPTYALLSLLSAMGLVKDLCTHQARSLIAMEEDAYVTLALKTYQ